MGVIRIDLINFTRINGVLWLKPSMRRDKQGHLSYHASNHIIALVRCNCVNVTDTIIMYDIYKMYTLYVVKGGRIRTKDTRFSFLVFFLFV